MEGLKRQRAALKGQVTRISVACQTPSLQVSKARALKTKLDGYMVDFERIQNEIELLFDEQADLSSETEYRVEFENAYYNNAAILSDIIEPAGVSNPFAGTMCNEINQSLKVLTDNQCALTEMLKSVREQTPRPISITKVDSNTRLPQTKLPEFHGGYDEWMRFHDLFVAMVYSKENISGAEKMDYLLSCLKGNTSSVIKHLAPTNANFDVAWNLLKSLYDKPHFIMVAHLDNLFESPVLKGTGLDEIKCFFRLICENINALRGLNKPVDSWNVLLVYVLAKKMDEENRVLWVRYIKNKVDPTIEDLTDFLKERINELESLAISRDVRVNKKVPCKTPSKRVHTTTVQPCIKCKRNHYLYQCNEFRNLSVPARVEFVKTNKICENCLRVKHSISECKYDACRLCSQKHNTLLHQGHAGPEVSIPGCSKNIACGMSVHSINHALRECYTPLPTALVSVVNDRGQLHQCRALLDSGSQSTLISEDCAQRLNLKRSHARIPIRGIGQNGSSLGTRGVVSLNLHSSGESKYILSTKAYVLSKLTSELPTLSIPKSKLAFFETLQLADPQCFLPGKIDILLGSDVFFDILTDGKIVHPSGSPTAQSTAFGWILAGNISFDSHQHLNVFQTTVDLDDLDYLLQRFWEHEDVQEIRSPQPNVHEQIENHFASTHFVRPDGRYVISLPFKTSVVEFGNSRNSALRVLHSMERKFLNNAELKQEYTQFMREYELLGHMAAVLPSELHQPSFYMPHHAVLKPSSTTTKLRVVFNASCKSSNGISLNDYLMVGPVIQNDLVTSLIGFRKFAVAVKADIAKMYRQIMVSNGDTNYQRIVWREDVSQEPIDYRLLTLTYGTAPASFIATRVLKQIGINGAMKYPQASNSLKHNFYVDDYNEGFYSVEDAVQTKNDLFKILGEARMELRKWASNSSEFLSTFEAESLEISTDLPMGDASVKLLGLVWDTQADIFKFSLQLPSLRSRISKREVLSDIARIFDPLGLLSPTIIKMKIFMQKLWLKGISWDAIIPSELFEEWADIRADLRYIAYLRIPRWIQHERGKVIELHGFADASESAYAAAVYCRVIRTDGCVSTSLICAKTRVAPVRTKLTIPKLELCGALLLTKLLSKTKESFNSHNIECFAYTDASTVLQWIQGYPRPRNVFADNRLAQITAQLPSSSWHYVRSAENPADCGTRGIMPNQLTSLDLWWKGPLFLQKTEVIFTQLPNSKEVVEEHEVSCFASPEEPEWEIFQRFGSLQRLLRVVARCIRLIRRFRKPRVPLVNHCLSPSDINSAKIALLKISQRTSFANEIDCLLSKKPVPVKSKIFRMNPFIDEDGVLRVGGRLSNAEIPFDQMFPVILHKNHRFTYLIVLDCHLRNLHAGIRQMTYLLSLNHFIVDVHHAVKRCVYRCPDCMRQRAIPFKQQMGDLPRQRLEPGLVFNNTGVDYAGPFTVTSWKGRGAKRFKTYIALFVCLATKALHLEAVTDLTSEAFIAALRRFVARRGRCQTIFSDNGTNFVGANNQLREWSKQFLSDQFQGHVTDELTSQGINWRFIPPHAPHFGGLWEAGVKTVKFHLRRILGNTIVTYEEFATILCQIEACANSRPLCSRFEGDVDPLTPAHFLIMRPMTSVPDQPIDDGVKTLKRWQHVQRLVQHFWKRWSSDYLSQLQKRNKWSAKLKDIQVNDIVIIKDDNQPPCQWLVGRVTQVYPGTDGLVRVVSVVTSKGEAKRPISKLCPLFIDI